MNIDDCIDAFRRGEPQGSSGNVSFRDGVLWSYAMPIAWRMPSGLTLRVNHVDSPSVTTTRHIGRVNGLELPPSTELNRLRLDPSRITAVQTRTWDPHGYRAEGTQITFLSWDGTPMHMLRVPVGSLRVSQYHQVSLANPGHIWWRLPRPVTFTELERLPNLMRTNPPRRRIQDKLQLAFEEGRLAQYGSWLLEQRPDIGTKRVKIVEHTEHVTNLGLPHVRVTKTFKRDRTLFVGVISGRRYHPHGTVCQIHPNIHSGIEQLARPTSVADIPLLNLKRLQ